MSPSERREMIRKENTDSYQRRDFWLCLDSQCFANLIQDGKGDLPWDHQFHFETIIVPLTFVGWPGVLATTDRYGGCWRLLRIMTA